MVSIEFGSRQAANNMRDRIGEYLARQDSRVEMTVRLKASTPDSVKERVREAALGSRETRSSGAGKATLADKEQESLNRQHSTFNWQQHGFEAMSVKAAMQSEGVSEWMDYYEPGEGVDSAKAKLRQAKGRSQQSNAGIGIEGMRQDTAEMGNQGRRAQQSERMSAERTRSAKEPALVEQDPDATAFLREEQMFNDDVFDIAFESDTQASGRDVELLEERNEQRSDQAQLMDDLKAAPVTRDPLQWSNNPASYDFPGVDTLEPEKVQDRRSDAAQAADAAKSAPIAQSPQEWRQNMDGLDLPGVDTKGNGNDATPMKDDRDRQDTLGFAADATEARDSRLEGEQNTGGIMSDERESTGMGVETNDMDAGEQAGLDAMDAAMQGRDMDMGENAIDDDMDDLDGFL